jgi:hypothetical protein
MGLRAFLRSGRFWNIVAAMDNDIMDKVSNRADLAANGKWTVILNGQLVYTDQGRARLFNSQAEALAFIGAHRAFTMGQR